MYIIYPEKDRVREKFERILCLITLILWGGFIYGGLILGLIIRLVKKLTS
jgi:hypothetical protein